MVTRIRTPAVRVLTLLAAALLVLPVACQKTGAPGAAPQTPSHRSSTSPFTGLPARSGPVLAVKIDNVVPARPQTGLQRADLVYVERVEAGLTRLLAVFSSALPQTVGPVRSARESDLDLLRQFGHPALAYSGAQSRLRPMIDAAPLYALPPGKVPDAYYRSPDRRAPHNLYLRPAVALRASPHTSPATDIGLRFGTAPAGGTPVTVHTVRHPAATISFTWSQGRQRWLVAMDGTALRTPDDEPVVAATVVVQHVTIRPSALHDRWGNMSPYTETTGAGSALVLRDGRAYEALWSRPAAETGTAFSAADGTRLPFARGPVWIVYVPR